MISGRVENLQKIDMAYWSMSIPQHKINIFLKDLVPAKATITDCSKNSVRFRLHYLGIHPSNETTVTHLTTLTCQMIILGDHLACNRYGLNSPTKDLVIHLSDADCAQKVQQFFGNP